MGWKPKSTRMLISIGNKHIAAARHKVDRARNTVQEIEQLLAKRPRAHAAPALSNR